MNSSDDSTPGSTNSSSPALRLENKSALLEAALAFALDDLERGPESRILKRIGPVPVQR